MTPPLLQLEQVRCSVAGATVLDNVTLCTTGDRVGLSGNTLGVRALLTGEATLVSGQAMVLGQTLSEARKNSLFGCAVALTHVPKKWTIRRVLELAAEIGGRSVTDAASRAAAAAAEIGEVALLTRRWSTATPIERALAVLALGVVTDPPMLFVSPPFGVLSSDHCQRYGAALARAAQVRKLLLELACLPQDPSEQSWVKSLDSINYVFDGRDTCSGAPLRLGQARYVLRVVGNAADVAAALQQVAMRAWPIHAPSDWSRGRCAFLVDVDCDATGVADTGALLDMCIQSALPILELLPV
jgi:hypothetical protein